MPGEVVLGVVTALVVLYAVTSTRRVNRERATVLAGLVGANIMIGLSPTPRGSAVPCDAVVESVHALRTVQFASLMVAVAGDEFGLPWGWSTIDGAGWVWLVQVRWVETDDGTRWSW